MAMRTPGTAGKIASESKHVLVTGSIAAALGLLIVFGQSIIALVVPVMVGILALLAIVRKCSSSEDHAAYQHLLRWTLAAFAAHLAIGLVVTYAGGVIAEYFFAPDAITYHQKAQELLAHWTEGAPIPLLPAGKEGFYYLLAGLYWVFGVERLAGLAVNAALAAAIVPLLSDATRRLFGPAAARRVPLLVLLVPGLLLWPSLLLKEAAVVFCVAFAINCAVRITERVTGSALVGMAAALAFLFTLRAWVALVMAAGLIAGVTLAKRSVGGLVSGLVGASLVAALVGLGVGYSGYQEAIESDLAEAHDLRRDLATAGSGFDEDVDVSTPNAAVSYLPEGLAKFLLGPFPWQLKERSQLVVIPDVIAWWILLPLLWLGYRAGRRRIQRGIHVLVLPALLTMVMVCLAIGNFGTMVRERVQVLVFLVPIAAFGLAEITARRVSVVPEMEDSSTRGPIGR